MITEPQQAVAHYAPARWTSWMCLRRKRSDHEPGEAALSPALGTPSHGPQEPFVGGAVT
ncbi:hypothetical protein [Streptomyces sp. NPDC092307]|uniref:hypothetical protein n=1 Tax=Streptomyces sp. NPDC092307 TaxID=3366013 RepID=UPI00382D0313